MSEDVENTVPQILGRIEEDLASFRREVGERLDRMEAELRRIEALQMQARRDLAAMWFLAAPLDHGRVLS